LRCKQKQAYLSKNIIAGERNGRRLMTQTGSSDDIRNGSRKAVNDSGTEGTHYGTGTTANQDVVATAGDNKVDFTTEGSVNAATLIGTAGNAVATTKSAGLEEASFASTHLVGGLDITAAPAGRIIVANGVLYAAKAECTATDNNWDVYTADA
jgi:hypothetical protein